MGSDSSLIGAGKFLQLLNRDGWEYVHRLHVTAVVAIVPVWEDKLILVEQPRPAVQARAIEFPAGLVGDIAGLEGESVVEAARRELLEETGFEAGSLEELCVGPASAGATDEMITFFMARDLRKVGQGGGDETEDIIVHAVPGDQIESWLEERRSQGCIVDLKVYTGLYFWLKERLASR